MIFILLIAYVNCEFRPPHYYGSQYENFNYTDESARSFYWSYGYTIAPNGQIWIADWEESTIKFMTEPTKIGLVTKVSGIKGLYGYRDGHIATALYNEPMALTYFEYSNSTTNEEYSFIFISDTKNHCVRKLDPNTNSVEEFAGRCQTEGFKDGQKGVNRLSKPTLVGYDVENTLYVFDSGNRYIRMIDIFSGEMSTLIQGVCDSNENIGESLESLPTLPYEFEEYGNLLFHVMVCMKSYVKTFGEPSEHIVEESDEEDCIVHDILCGERTHPLVAKDYSV